MTNKIGNDFKGGKIVTPLSERKNGLICASSDFSLNGEVKFTWDHLKKIINSRFSFENDKWGLPYETELKEVYLYKHIVGDLLKPEPYWISVGIKNGIAAALDFNSGRIVHLPENTLCRVRLVQSYTRKGMLQ